MPLEKLTREDLALMDLAHRVPTEYIAFMQRMLPGDGARATVAGEGVSRAMIKKRLNAVATALGMELEYLPTGPEQVAFVVVRITGDWAGRTRRGGGVTSRVAEPKPEPVAAPVTGDLVDDLQDALKL